MRAELICVVVSLFTVNGLHLPEYIKACRFDSPDFMECALKHGNDALPNIVKGDRSYGIPSFTPFKITSVGINSHGLDMNLTDATFSGVENLKLQKYIVDQDKRMIYITMTGPLLKFEFDYQSKGKIASLPIEGNGHGWAKFYNGNYSYDYNYELKSRNGKHYIDIGKYKVTIEPERIECEYGNLFNGNKELAKYIKACSPNSPDFEECAIRNGNEAISQLVKGDRQYGIPSFLPFRMPFVTIFFNGLDMNLTDASFSGLENLKLQSYKFNLDKKISSIVLKGPLISFEFDYLTKGRISAFPIEGEGHGFAKFYNASYMYDYNFDVKTKNKKQYMVIDKDNIKIEPESVQCELGNLFNGNKQLGDNLNKFLNENWRELLVEFGPVVSEVNRLIAKEIMRKIFERIPLDELFPGIKL